MKYKIPGTKWQWLRKLICLIFGHNVFQTDPARWQCARCGEAFYKSW